VAGTSSAGPSGLGDAVTAAAPILDQGLATPVVCRVGALDARSRPPRPWCRWPSAGMRVCVIGNSADSVVGSAL